jgi:hypothetical protein
VGTGAPCAVHVTPGGGQAIVLGCDLPLHLPVWRSVLAALGVRRRWAHDARTPGVIVVPVRDRDARLLAVINVAPYAVDLAFETEEGRAFTPDRLHIPARSTRLIASRDQSRESSSASSSDS